MTDHSPERVALVAALIGACFPDVDGGANDILDALLAAGWLIPEGSRVREEWGSRMVWDTGDEEDWFVEDRRRAEHRVAFHRMKAQEFADWRVREASLIQRKIITTPPTPWSPSVPDTEEGTSRG